MNWPRPLRRIGWRIFTFFALLLVSVSLLFSITGLKFADETIRSNAENELRIMSINLSRQVQRQLNHIEETLNSLEHHGFLVEELRKAEPNRAEIEEFLQNRLTSLALFEELAIYNRNGVCVGATDPSWYDIPGKQQAFFITGLRQFNFSDIYTSDEGKIQLVSTPINNGTMTRGVLVGQVNMSWIYDVMDQQLGVLPNTDAFLIDSALRFITPGKTGIDRLLESHLIATPLIKHLNQEFWVGQYPNFNGSQVLGTVSKIPNRRWYVVVERDLVEVVKPIKSAAKVIVAVSLLLIGVLILLTYLLTRSITRPLMTLVEGAQRVATGDFKQPFTIPQGIDEVAFLASEFDKMRGKVAAFQERMIERLEESERKRLESERLAAIGTLASSLAHEIRNPLNAMSLLLARLELSKSSDEVRSHVTRDLRGEIGRLDRLVSDILDYARPLNLQCQDIDLGGLVQNTLELYRGVFDGKQIRCELRLPVVPVRLRLDVDRVKQALVNLIQNAVDAMAQNGTLIVTIESTELWGQAILRDDGVGLPSQPTGRLFDLFFTTKEKGTGLGLSTVKKIMDAHRGEVTIGPRSDVRAGIKPQGSEVVLSFPLHS